ncbi:MAG: hypothetical protein JNJ88_21400 [Planctomycetes bacterium]|nr:hypothetical protein [Planctomycetota bacterium]
MMVLFIALVGKLISGYDTYRDSETGGPASAPKAKPESAPTAPSPEEQLPTEASLAARNVEWSGNLTPLETRDGLPLGLSEAEHRLAVDVGRASREFFQRRISQLPPMKDLLAGPSRYRGSTFAVRCIPMEVVPHSTDVPSGRVYSWRVYALLQRSPDEAVVFETLEEPPQREWILKRDVLEVEGLFLRTATYETVSKRNPIKSVPYLIAKSFEYVTDAPKSATNVFGVLLSRYGPMVALGIVLFVLLTVWTIRRFANAQEKAERDYFYAMIRAKKRPVAEVGDPAKTPPAGQGGPATSAPG